MGFLRNLGCLALTLSDDAGAGVGRMLDIDGIYSSYLAEKKAVAMLVRPDINLFGFGAELKDVADLVKSLQQKLSWRATALAA
ncbi:hypothetical protein [Bradyrhizobium arachidis]|uniref:hypothetical protein n=1 Tax=Bradyrhizobium arachidis TaxID=858423 RepID=UPI002163279B|nr:hypothetical protein [Bradyrhizobium arachidis]UVO30536.1 hypothetical protein KUF59_07665 [Bradyrhizobium arachidis]